MTQLLRTLLLAIPSTVAFAQSTGAEPPVEHASMVTVAIFIILFIGGCVGMVGYMWWNGRKEAKRDGR
jgi:hypothetical protein